jgi:hypothetical protein
LKILQGGGDGGACAEGEEHYEEAAAIGED